MIVVSATTKLHKEPVYQNTNCLFMKESSLSVPSVEATTRSNITEQKNHSMMRLHLIVTSVIISHLGGVCLLGMLRLYSVHEGITCNCDKCDYTATPERLYIRNFKHEHEEMKCQKCEHKMVAKKILVRHTLYDHEGIKDRPGNFVCNQCSTPFAS